jgi:CheY-like chemotaxis protein
MNKIKVLLVEDETSLAMILSDTLEAQGFEMRTAHDGEEGLRMFDDQKPDVLVADVMMPKMDGFEMVRRIRKTDSRTPVLFLTARSAVTGGGLTIIANAPNPAGVAILKSSFDDESVSPLGLFLAALPPTMVAMLAFLLL